MMDIQPLGTIIFAVVGGIASLILGRKTRFPSILFLLIFGILLGPHFANVIQPGIFRSEFPYYVSILVALILFEGGTSLKFSQLHAISGPLRGLLTIGVLVTLTGVALLTRAIVGMSWTKSVLFGAIMVVSGPTVVIPILQRVRVRENIHNILKWEAILIDPLGVVIAIVLFEFLLSEHVSVVTGLGLFCTRLLLGGALGLFSGWVMHLGLTKKWLLHHEEELGGLFVLAINLFFYGIGEWILPDSGLVVSTAAGIYLGNKKFPSQDQIFHFKKQITLLALSCLFVLLSSNVPIPQIKLVTREGLLLLCFMIFIIRPLAVFLSTARSQLTLGEKAFLSFLAPRGIVSASLASLFALEFEEQLLTTQGHFLPLAFLVISGSILFYALSSDFIAHMLHVKEETGKGIVVVGANALGLILGEELRKRGIPVKMLDSNPGYVRDARRKSFDAYVGSGFNHELIELLDFKGMGRMIALTPNHEVNVLSCQTFSRYLGKENVFRFSGKTDSDETSAAPIHHDSWGKMLYSSADLLNNRIFLENIQRGRYKIETQTTDKAFDITPETLPLPSYRMPLFIWSNDQILFPVLHTNIPAHSDIIYLTLPTDAAS